MDSYRQIAISKISDILSGNKLILPSIDLWKTIYFNAGQSSLYLSFEDQLKTKVVPYGYRDDERNYFHNDYCFSALFETITAITNEQELIRFFNSVVEKILLAKIFPADIEEILENDHYRVSHFDFFDINEFILELKVDEKNKVLKKHAGQTFKAFLQNLHLIGLEVCFDDKSNLTVLPFADSIRESTFDKSILMEWLQINYSNISGTYSDAVKAYSNGDSVACITHCRNIITGIFSTQKDPQRKWMDGLLKVCANDKNINNAPLNKLHTYVYNANADDVNQRYQYPRYNLIYRLYAFSCALGAHINEGNTTTSGVDFEIATSEDALMCLRMTEDMLIWLYQGNI